MNAVHSMSLRKRSSFTPLPEPEIQRIKMAIGETIRDPCLLEIMGIWRQSQSTYGYFLICMRIRSSVTHVNGSPILWDQLTLHSKRQIVNHVAELVGDLLDSNPHRTCAC